MRLQKVVLKCLPQIYVLNPEELVGTAVFLATETSNAVNGLFFMLTEASLLILVSNLKKKRLANGRLEMKFVMLH